jgi:hypothetical protein
MSLPAVAIAAAFACDIAQALHPAVARNAASLLFLSSSFVTVAVLVLTGILLVKIGSLLLAAATSQLTWVLLGFLGVCIAEQPRAADHVISLIEQGQLPLGTPLRWHGHLAMNQRDCSVVMVTKSNSPVPSSKTRCTERRRRIFMQEMKRQSDRSKAAADFQG